MRLCETFYGHTCPGHTAEPPNLLLFLLLFDLFFLKAGG